jgi:hypothetical protein
LQIAGNIAGSLSLNRSEPDRAYPRNGLSSLLKKHAPSRKRTQLQIWGWAFELKYDSLPRLGFKEVLWIQITDPPVGKLAYKNEH